MTPTAPLACPGPRVLLAEADPIHQVTTRRLLERMGLQVAVAGDGEEAVSMALQGGFDLALLALQLPRLDGLSAARLLRGTGLQALPLVAMSANASDAQHSHCAAAGFNDLLPRPLDARTLADSLACWLPGAAPACKPLQVDLTGLPQDVPGLDVEGALERLMGRKSLYLEVLLRYVESQQRMPAQLRATVQAGDLAQAHRLAHTAKGLAATIGAPQVEVSAQYLEDYLRGPSTPAQIMSALDDFEDRLTQLLGALPARLFAAPLPT